MAKNPRKKITTVREHPMHVPVSEKNPTGITIRDRHLRRLKGTFLDATEIESIFKNYDRKGIAYPTKRKLTEKYKNADKYDEVIADPPLDPDVVKALISSESDFNPDPLGNRKIAIGITQITKKTLKILQDPNGEAKEFIFKDIRQKDLKNPNISIPMVLVSLLLEKAPRSNQVQRIYSHYRTAAG